MSACDTCRRPGSCCTSFTLNFSVPRATWRESAIKKLASCGLDYFEPVRPLIYLDDHDHTGVVYRCLRLGEDGRCTDYENRPQLCHLYQPGQDGMCAEFVRSFRGVPVVTVTA